MPACSNAIHPSGISISFTEDDHKYSSVINNKEITYISSTTFIHNFFPEFDPTGEILKRKAAKLGKTPEELKLEWDKNRDASCLFGTRTHSLCEDILLNRPCRVEAENEKEKLVFANGRKIAEKFKASLDIIDVEKIIFNPFLPKPIAGTIDLLARSRKDGSILILDWKTNKSIDQENKFNKFGLDPIKHIPDINWYHYSLQTSLYQYLLILGKYIPANSKFKRAIIHLTETDAKIYQLPDMTSEIKDMIIWDQMKFN
jgi:ATP-dependent exoDNAse (exonuclease V) beta subunit